MAYGDVFKDVPIKPPRNLYPPGRVYYIECQPGGKAKKAGTTTRPRRCASNRLVPLFALEY